MNEMFVCVLILTKLFLLSSYMNSFSLAKSCVVYLRKAEKSWIVYSMQFVSTASLIVYSNRTFWSDEKFFII